MLKWNDLQPNMTHSERYEVSKEFLDGFVNLFNDKSPIHNDPAFALKHGYKEPIMYGAMLNGFLAHFTGQRFPGPMAMTLTVDMKYSNPFYLGDQLIFKGTIKSLNESFRVALLDVSILNSKTEQNIANARVQVKILE